MEPSPIKTLNKVQIALFLFALCFAGLSVNAQQNNQRTSSAIATATIISEMVGVDQFESMNFTDIKDNQSSRNNRNSMANQGNASFSVISDNYTYALTIPDEDILMTKKGCADTIRICSLSIVRDSSHHGRDRHLIGGVLTVNTFEIDGYYKTENPLIVTVNYN